MADDTIMHCGLCPDRMPATEIVNHVRLMHPDHHDPLDVADPIVITAGASR